ncbi:extensin family protein [Rhizobium sp.]|jgi:hypothetical protein|uniref:extensin-like domain-containing protein n=1 Tax=Rhizobium sp. TaxID=391 RepID=UPI000E8BF37F|nr:extensin [Rhizobium sp.]
MIHKFLMMTSSLLYLTAAALPPEGPVPDARPERPSAHTTDPKAEPKTDTTNSDHSRVEPQAPLPSPPASSVPTPQPSPAKPEPAAETAPAPETKPVSEPQPSPPPIISEDPQAYSQCINALTQAGAVFTEKPRIDDGDGCGIDKPIEVSKIMPGIALSPSGTLRCQAALELSQWIKTVVIPAADQAMPDMGKLTAVNQASTYLCRKRNSLSEGKISEHARGNAIDIAALAFEKGKVPMTITPENEPTMHGAFQRTLNASACLYFTTVLAPGSDETHQDHMHLDLIKRNNDARYCRNPE